jgi:Domain of unknown function (DU1801)
LPKQSAEFKQLLSTMPEHHAAISLALHDLVLVIYPEAHESIWLKQNIASYGVGPKKMSEHFVYIAAYRNHVNLGFYQGSEMVDRDGILQGTGAGLRHIKIRSLEEAKSMKLPDYIKAALKLRQSQ